MKEHLYLYQMVDFVKNVNIILFWGNSENLFVVYSGLSWKARELSGGWHYLGEERDNA